MNKTIYNKTQLDPDKVFERHIFHRDQIAHVMRWFYVAKIAQQYRGEGKILDFGCGSGNLAKLLYHNRWAPKKYLGLDVRHQTIEKLKEDWKDKAFASFECRDLCKPIFDLREEWDIISCFEVIEHIGHENAPQFLQNIKDLAGPATTILLSTPNYDPNVGPADNHIIDGKIGEWDHKELQALLEQYFVIDKKIGTFASIADYKDSLNAWQLEMFNNLREFYDSNMLSIIMAPLIPAEKARNCLWVLKVKQ